MADTLATTFWNRIEDIRAGMLSTSDAPARPMAHKAQPDDATLWFITADGTDIAKAARAGQDATYILASQHAKLYATVAGALRVETDQAKLDEIWSPMAAMWFDDGKRDDDVCLVQMRLSHAEVWETDGAAKALYEAARANLSGDSRPDLGEHGTIRF